MNNVAQPLATALRPDDSARDQIPKIGGLLVRRGKISGDDLKAIAAVQRERDLRFGDAAVSLGLIDNRDLDAVLAEQFSYTSQSEHTRGLSRELFMLFNPNDTRAEAMRSLRSELLLRHVNKTKNASLAVVGAEDAAGLALSSANLAVAFAQLGMKTLLIDGNLRKPGLYDLFGLNQRIPGLSDMIAHRAPFNPLPVPGLNSLWMIPSGTPAPNPQELLASQTSQDYLRLLAANFDVTLINTAPLDGAMDAQLLAAGAGAALIVVKEDVSQLEKIATIYRSLNNLGITVPGAVLVR